MEWTLRTADVRGGSTMGDFLLLAELFRWLDFDILFIARLKKGGVEGKSIFEAIFMLIIGLELPLLVSKRVCQNLSLYTASRVLVKHHSWLPSHFFNTSDPPFC
jgi:hypothetical protein